MAYLDNSGLSTLVNLIKNFFSTHTSNKNNPHETNKEQVGLGNVDNTADADKNVATAVSATNDSNNQKITSTYIKDMSADGRTLTYTKGDDTSNSFAIQFEEFAQVTLDVLNWSDTAPYTQTVTVEGITADETPIIECKSEFTSLAEKKRVQQSWNMVDEIQTGDGVLIATCNFEKPTSSLPLIIKK